MLQQTTEPVRDPGEVAAQLKERDGRRTYPLPWTHHTRCRRGSEGTGALPQSDLLVVHRTPNLYSAERRVGVPRLRRRHRLTVTAHAPPDLAHGDRTTDRTEKTMTRLDRALTQYSRTTVRIDTATRTGTLAALAALHLTCRQWEDEARTFGASTADLAHARRSAAS